VKCVTTLPSSHREKTDGPFFLISKTDCLLLSIRVPLPDPLFFALFTRSVANVSQSAKPLILVWRRERPGWFLRHSLHSHTIPGSHEKSQTPTISAICSCVSFRPGFTLCRVAKGKQRVTNVFRYPRA